MNVVELEGVALAAFLDQMAYLAEHDLLHSLKVGIDPIDQALKVKVDNGTWSPPMGRVIA